MRTCSVCKTQKPLTEFHRDKSRKGGLNYSCKCCMIQRRAEYYSKNASIANKASRRWNEENSEKNKEAKRLWYLKNSDRQRALHRKWSRENPDQVSANSADRRAAKAARTPPWLTSRQCTEIQSYYALAAARSKELGRKMHVDHIVPLKGKLVSGLHVPWNLQVIPAEENLSKGNRLNLKNVSNFKG
jgi:hypothetical protein